MFDQDSTASPAVEPDDRYLTTDAGIRIGLTALTYTDEVVRVAADALWREVESLRTRVTELERTLGVRANR